MENDRYIFTVSDDGAPFTRLAGIRGESGSDRLFSQADEIMVLRGKDENKNKRGHKTQMTNHIRLSSVTRSPDQGKAGIPPRLSAR